MLSKFRKNKKTGDKRRYVMHLIGIIVLIVLGLLVIANITMYQKRKEFSAQVASLEKQINDIKTNNERLQKGIDSADDNQYIEKVAREELDLQKSGEQAVSFVTAESDVEVVDTSKQNFLQKLWSWITGN